MNVLITGRAGSGKSTVANELQRRGITAFDSDKVPNLARWVNVATHRATTVEDYTIVDKTKVEWREAVLAGFLTAHPDVFLCGSADNDLTLHRHFQRAFVLNASPEAQTHRLQTRTNSDYGKDPRMITTILAEQATLVTNARAIGATIIDANPPVEEVVNEILRQIA